MRGSLSFLVRGFQQGIVQIPPAISKGIEGQSRLKSGGDRPSFSKSTLPLAVLEKSLASNSLALN
jgi:hypothetical protein